MDETPPLLSFNSVDWSGTIDSLWKGETVNGLREKLLGVSRHLGNDTESGIACVESTRACFTFRAERRGFSLVYHGWL